jgi:dimethylamine monooxygenase subunit A
MDTAPGELSFAFYDRKPKVVFRRLFSGEEYRFEFGMRRGNDRWFEFGRSDSPILCERRSLLTQKAPGSMLWSEGAEDLVTETLALFPPTEGVECRSTEGDGTCSTLAQDWEPDFLVLRRSSTDEFRLAAGSVCFPSWWSPEEKVGMAVEAIHGVVPTLNASLGSRIHTFLSRLPAGVTFERENWGLAAVPDRNLHPNRQLPRLGPDSRLDSTWLRIEHQAFRALPVSHGVLFIIHLTIHPLAEVLADRECALGFQRILRKMSPEIADYKGITPGRAALIEQLDGRLQ